MKLAEALALRGDAQKRLAQIEARATAVARYQEGEEPAEDATVLLAQARVVADEIEGLIVKINRTNAATEISAGFTITDAIARRDVLGLRRKTVVAVADAAAGTGDDSQPWGRQLRSELREMTDVPVADLRQEADDLAKQYREVDLQIQAANWATELVE